MGRRPSLLKRLSLRVAPASKATKVKSTNWTKLMASVRVMQNDSNVANLRAAQAQHETRRRRPALVKRFTQAIPALLIESEIQSIFKRLMSGGLLSTVDDLPLRNSRTVRVFLCSTFSDMHAERNIIMHQVYPRLRQYCRQQHGIALQIVDMRWGIQDGATVDQTASEICFAELFNCQRLSIGPHFLGILSHRYGTRQLPHKLQRSEMEALEKRMAQFGNETALGLLRKWYRLDENQKEAVFVFQSPASLADGDETRAAEARAAWRKEEGPLVDAVVTSAERAAELGEMSSDRALHFSASVTHLEFVHGVLQCRDERRQDALLFCREIEDVREQVQAGDKAVSRFVETQPNGSLDEATFERIQRLKEQQLPAVLPLENIITHRLRWSSVIDGDADYEGQLASDIERQLRRLIDRGVGQLSALESDSVYTEVLQHSHQCVSYVKQFQGREDCMEAVRSQLTGPSSHPLVIHGCSGSGKTSVLARAGVLVRDWLPDSERSDAVVLVRFLGTSPASSSIRQTLKSLCQQMCVFLGHSETELLSTVEDFRDLVDSFYRMAESLCQQGQRVFVFLDSLDQLDGSDGAHTLSWLRAKLPSNMKLVVSCLPELHGILDACRMLLDGVADSFVEVVALEPSLCSKIVEELLSARSRNLTESQWSMVREAFRACSLPIFMNLVFNEVVQWRSYTPVESLQHTVRGAIEHLFGRLERQFGTLLVRHSLSYITASRNGLGDLEMEDLLSLDEDVLGEIFAHHLPPFIRVPPLCWTRVRHELGDYLVEREADDNRVVFWYHRQFWEVAQEYLFSDKSHARQTHSRLADYFLGVWAGRAKPFHCPKNLAAKLSRQGTPPPTEADRQVAAQPNCLQVQADGSRRLNLRKLSELPYQLVRSGRIEDFHREVTFNADFLECRLSGSSRYQLLRDLRLFLDFDESEIGDRSGFADAERVFNAIRIASLSLGHSSLAISVDLCGRLRHFADASPNIRRLLDGCRSSAQSARLIPMNSCFDSGSSFNHCTVQVQLALGKLSESGLMYTVSLEDNSVRWFDLEGNELKEIQCASPVLVHSHVRHMKTVSESGCFLVLARECPDDDQSYRIFKTNLHTGDSSLVLHSLPSEVALAAAQEGENVVFASSENYILLKILSLRLITSFILLHPKSSQLVRLRAMQSRWSGPFLNGDRFLFFLGHSEFSRSEPPTNSALDRPRIIILTESDLATEIELDCPELKPFVLTSETPKTQPLEAFCVKETLLIITRTAHADVPQDVVFTVHCFTIVGSQSHRMHKWTRPNSNPHSEFSVVLSADVGSAALVFRTPVRSGMGFVCRLADGEFCQLAYHPVLEESHNLDNDDSAAISPFLDSVFLSANGDLLLAKACSGYMFNIWSGTDGSFLRTVAGNSDFYAVGQPSGTDFLAINVLPEDLDPNVQLKLLNIAALRDSESDCDFDSARITERMLKQGQFAYRTGRSGRFLVSFFDRQTNRGEASEVDFASGKRLIELEFSGENDNNALPDLVEKDEENVYSQDKKPSEYVSEPEKYLPDQETSTVEDSFEEQLAPKLKDYCWYWDLKDYNLALVRDPRTLGMRLIDTKPGILVMNAEALFQVESAVLAEDLEMENGLFKNASTTALPTVIITNHPQFSSMPAGYLSTNERPLMFDKTADLFAVLSYDFKTLFLLPRKVRFASQLLKVDLQTRRIQQASSRQLPVRLVVGEEFVRNAGRRAAIEAMRVTASDLVQAQSRLTSVPLEKEKRSEFEMCKFAISQSRELLRRMIAEYQDAEAEKEADSFQLAGQLAAQLSELLSHGAGGDATRVDSAMRYLTDSGLESALRFRFKIKAQDTCEPVMLFAGSGQHSDQLIIQYRIVSIDSYAKSLERETMCWPGQLLVLDCYSALGGIRSVSKTFDAGILCLLPDGAHCVTYRLKIVNIVTGETARDLDPSNSVVLKDLLMTSDGRLVIGRRLAPGQRIRRDLDEETEELLSDGQRVLQAFSLADGTQLFNYLFEEEPTLLLSPSPNRLVIVLRDHPVQLYEIMATTKQSGPESLKKTCKPVSNYLQGDYLSFVGSVLSRGLARVADVRPTDPIDYLGRWLLNLDSN